eukprot:scaffold277193_cov19-Prasinocladus_malaysianus.AAC.1
MAMDNHHQDCLRKPPFWQDANAKHQATAQEKGRHQPPMSLRTCQLTMRIHTMQVQCESAVAKGRG